MKLEIIPYNSEDVGSFECLEIDYLIDLLKEKKRKGATHFQLVTNQERDISIDFYKDNK